MTDGVIVKWCLDNSISSQVTTPVSAADLASALISALESSTVSPVAATNDVTFDILLAEDNLVNQKLAVKILEKYGHVVEIAENGSLAVEAFKARVQKNRPFDIILVSIPSVPNCAGSDAVGLTQMDVSMPFMGGMEATEHIRAYEMHHCIDRSCQYVASHHDEVQSHPITPVIGDRERCLQAGMDDHITSGFMTSLYSYQTPDIPAEPLRRSDLLNSITKLGGERVKSKQSRTMHRPQLTGHLREFR
jgi:osomolarity two-component system sensor histidine kinase NIK1